MCVCVCVLYVHMGVCVPNVCIYSVVCMDVCATYRCVGIPLLLAVHKLFPVMVTR